MANIATKMDVLLNPRDGSTTVSMRDAPSLPPLRLHRSHLDSATYRSFVCLLSHCLGATTRSLNPHGPGTDEGSSISPMGPEVGVRLREESGLDPEEVDREKNGDLSVPTAVELQTVGCLGRGGRSPVQYGIDLGQRDEEERGVEYEGSRLDGAIDGAGASAVVGCQNGGSSRGLVQGEVDGDGSDLGTSGRSGDNGGKGGENIEKNEVRIACFDSSRVLEEGEELLMVDDNGSNLPKDDDSELLNIQKELSDCILDEFVGRVVSGQCAQEKLQEGVEHVEGDCFDRPAQTGEAQQEEGQEEHDGLSTVACHDDQVFESQELVDDSNHKKLHSVMSQGEISCPVGETDDGNHQVSTACMKPAIFCSSNLHGKIMTKPLDVLNGAEFEEGEILGEFGDKIGVQGVEGSLTRVDTAGANITMMENSCAEHEFAGKSNSRNCSLNIVDYSDLYEIGHTSSSNKLSSLPESKMQSRIKKKIGGAKLMKPPRTGESNEKKNDECNVTSMDIMEKISIPELQKESKLKDAGVMEKNEKKKKGPLTEERKAKKKEAKKRKRAEKNRKLGIKRLKILPVSLPKKVIYCDFYLKGRCQKGDQCSFSHDTIPLTKSQPCKFFAWQSCLKGDDCPFDHELGKYPCHAFMSRGTCSRGEQCKFSHKIQVAEGSVSKLDTLKFSEAPNLGKQLSTSISSFQSVKYATANLNFGTPCSEQKHSLEIDRKPEMKVPKGINFLSFGKYPSENANNDKKLLSETSEKQLDIRRSSFQAIKNSPTSTKCSSPNSKFKPSVEQLKQTPQMNAPKGVHFLSFGENMIDNAKKPEDKLAKKSEVIEFRPKQDNESSRLQVSDIPPSYSLQGFSSRRMESDATDATKILEQFLFCGNT